MGSRPHVTMSSIFKPAPEPPTPLGRHRILCSTAGVKVSPLCIGAMNIGTAWEAFMGGVDKKASFELLDYFWEAGGNFIDTANNYQSQESETWIGEWMEARKNRDQMVVATKYTTFFKGSEGPKQASSFIGNNAKSLHTSVNASLKKLRTDYIDVLYLHWWDFSTSIEEVMQSLNRLVDQGKVLYLGISDTPAWIVSKANQYARDHGLAQFVVYQGLWSASTRDFERDILPMAVAEGMALAPWGALGRGHYKTAEQRKSDQGRRMGETGELDLKVSAVIEKIAKKHNAALTGVALAYVMHSAPNVFPIVGGRTVDHLKGNVDALKLRLDEQDMKELRQASGWEPGFPMNFLTGAQEPVLATTSDSMLTKSAVHIDVTPVAQPYLPTGK